MARKKKKRIKFSPEQKSIAIGVLLGFVLVFIAINSLRIHYAYGGTFFCFEDGVMKVCASEAYIQPEPWHSDEFMYANTVLRVSRGDYSLLAHPLQAHKAVFYATLFAVQKVCPTSFLRAYTYLPILNMMFLLVIVFLITKKISGSRLAAFIAILAIPLIKNNSTLTGLWFYIPFNLAMTFFFLFLLLYMHTKQHKRLLVIIFSIILMFTHFTMAYFLWISLLVNHIVSMKKFKKLTAPVISLLVVLFHVVVFFVCRFVTSKTHPLDYTLLKGVGLGFGILSVLPALIVLLGIFGFIMCFRKNDIYTSSASVAITLWVFYFLGSYVFINPAKLPYFAAIFICIYSGIGVVAILKLLKTKKILLTITKIVIIVFIFLYLFSFYPSYTEIDTINYFLYDLTEDEKVQIFNEIDDLGMSPQVFTDQISSYILPHHCGSCNNGVDIGLYGRRLKNIYGKLNFSDCGEVNDVMVAGKYDILITKSNFSCPGYEEIFNTEKYEVYLYDN